MDEIVDSVRRAQILRRLGTGEPGEEVAARLVYFHRWTLGSIWPGPFRQHSYAPEGRRDRRRQRCTSKCNGI